MSKRTLTSLYQVNGHNLYAPDSPMEESYEDIDSADAGRDQAGYMHREVVRYDVGKWMFVYTSLTKAEYEYMESLFPKNGTFEFTRPSISNHDVPVTTTCYRSKRSFSWQGVDGAYKNYKFDIIEN